MLRDIEKENLKIGMYIRVLIRLIKESDKNKLLDSIKSTNHNISGIKRIKYKEEIDEKTVLLIYYAPHTYTYKRSQDFLHLLNRIHKFMENSSGYLIDFMTTNRGDLDFSIIGSKHYLNGKLTADYYRVDDSILTTLTFFSQDAFNAAEKYKYLREFLPKL